METLFESYIMGSVDSKVDVRKIREEVSSVPVMIYTKNGCSFCTKAKSLFEKEGIEYRESNVDRVKSDAPEQYKPRVNGLVYMTRHTTMPQIFICGKFVGGYTDLEKLRDSRELYSMVLSCTEEKNTSD